MRRGRPAAIAAGRGPPGVESRARSARDDVLGRRARRGPAIVDGCRDDGARLLASSGSAGLRVRCVDASARPARGRGRVAGGRHARQVGGHAARGRSASRTSCPASMPAWSGTRPSRCRRRGDAGLPAAASAGSPRRRRVATRPGAARGDGHSPPVRTRATGRDTALAAPCRRRMTSGDAGSSVRPRSPGTRGPAWPAAAGHAASAEAARLDGASAERAVPRASPTRWMASPRRPRRDEHCRRQAEADRVHRTAPLVRRGTSRVRGPETAPPAPASRRPAPAPPRRPAYASTCSPISWPRSSSSQSGRPMAITLSPSARTVSRAERRRRPVADHAEQRAALRAPGGRARPCRWPASPAAGAPR